MSDNVIQFRSIAEQKHYPKSLSDTAEKAMDTETQFGGGSGGGSGDGLGERVARLESDVEYIKRDISEIKTDLSSFRKEMNAELSNVRKEISELRVDIHKGVNTMIIFSTTSIIASMAIMATIFAYIK